MEHRGGSPETMDPDAVRLAYLDPVTGTLIIQGIVAIVAAVIVKGKQIKQKLKSLFGGEAAAAIETADDKPDPPSER